NPGAIGYFGYAYYNANRANLNVVNIEGIQPNEATAESGQYPLSRPLFLYTSANILRDKPQVAQFINFYIDKVESQLGTQDDQIGYFPVSTNTLNLDRLEWLAATDIP